MKKNVNKNNDDKYTVAEAPPVDAKGRRRSVWAELFEECRVVPGVWRRTERAFTEKSAVQCASDVRSSHRRDPARMRMRGLRAGELWETVAGPSPDSSDRDAWFVWLRFVGPAPVAASMPVESVSEWFVVVDGVEYAWRP